MGVEYETASITKGCNRGDIKLKKSSCSSKKFFENVYQNSALQSVFKSIRKFDKSKRFQMAF